MYFFHCTYFYNIFSYSEADESDLSDLDKDFDVDLTSRIKHEPVGSDECLEGRV